MKVNFRFFSVALIAFNVLFILFFVFFNKQGFNEGAPGWILAILGSPTSFLLFPLHHSFASIFNYFILEYFIVSLFFQLQYQLFLLFLFKTKANNILYKVLCVFILVMVVFLSAIKMRSIILPNSLKEYKHSIQYKQ